MITMIHSFVHSRLDYCNSLFHGVSKNEIAALQSVQNRAARIVGAGRFEHISPVLCDLHWLPVRKRIDLKFVFWCLGV